MSYDSLSFQKLCDNIPKMSTSKIINHLNENGLSLRHPSVRDRRLYQAGVRMLKYQNYEFSATKVSRAKLYKCIEKIKLNLFDPEKDFYVVKTEPTFLNQLTEIISKTSTLEKVVEDLGFQDKTILEDYKKLVPNEVKQMHINIVKKAAAGKLNKTQKKTKQRIIDENEKIINYLDANNWFPLLNEWKNDKEVFDKNMGKLEAFLLLKQYDRAQQLYPGITKENLEFFVDQIRRTYIDYEWWEDPKPYKDYYWEQFRTRLLEKKTLQDMFVDKGVIKHLEYDPEILKQPDHFEIDAVREVVIKEPIYKIYHQNVWKEEKIPSSVNHGGFKLDVDSFEGLVEEIYQISDLPGFTILKRHWMKIPYLKKEQEEKMKKLRNSINERKAKLRGKEKRRYIKRNKGKKNFDIPLTQNEKTMLDIISSDYQVKMRIATESTKDKLKNEIKQDMLKLNEHFDNVGNYLIGNIKFKGDNENLPACISKRYNCIFRSLILRNNLYKNLNNHVNEYKHFLSKHKHKHNNNPYFSYEDY